MKSRTRLAMLSLAIAAAAGCAEHSEAPRIAVFGDGEDMKVIEGEWSGQYWGAPSGRSGPIRFSLAAEEGGTVARGDVTMLGGILRGRMESPGDATAMPASEALSISFVRVDPTSETVSGTLEPYLDPDCSCVVSTNFSGHVSRDRIEGSFVIRGGPNYPTQTGRWRVDRKRTTADQ